MAKGSARARVAALVKRLAPGGSAAEHAEAAHTLGRLCFDKGPNREYARRCGGVAALVGLLAPGGTDAVHMHAAAALRSLCLANAQNQDGVRECGGVAALVRLLAPGGPAALQQQAAGALSDLCRQNGQNRDSVRECGGIAALVRLLAAVLVPGILHAQTCQRPSCLALHSRRAAGVRGRRGAGWAAGARRLACRA